MFMTTLRLLGAAFAALLVCSPLILHAQELIIEPTGDGGPYLNEIIAGDTTSTGARNDLNRVYVLRRDGIYLINDDIVINGFPLRMKSEDGVGAKAIIYPVTNTTTGGFPDPIIDMRDHVWVKDVVMPGYVDSIPEEVANIASTIVRVNAPGFDLTLDGVVMSNTRGQHIRTESAARNVYVRNSIFANMGDLGRSNFGAGKAIDLRAGSVDTLLFVNNTFVNFQDRIIRHLSSTAPINYLLFDHNTIVNGMSYHGMIALGWMGSHGRITNNLFVDGFVTGADLNDETRQAEFNEHGELFPNGKPATMWIFSVPNDSTTWDIAGNYFSTSDEVDAFYANYAAAGVLGVGEPISQHLKARIGADSANAFTEVDLDLNNRPMVMLNMAEWYRTETGLTKETATFVREDDDFDRRPVGYFTGEFDAGYPTDNPAYTGAVGGLPAGDLNWFPDKKVEWEEQGGIHTDVEADPGQIPVTFVLNQNYPNPFNPTTNISYSLPEAARVTVAVYNVLGALVTRLVDDAAQPAGVYRVTWNGTDAGGAKVASGVYLYQLRAENTVVTKSMVLLK
ncbi:MAG TPA: FlgD immunoglobulin-like domain containing protein [Rhodothermales bacterium]|nr:FlgD immunoglobulin-like domain containing protein [Rhodothermales bacterium]